MLVPRCSDTGDIVKCGVELHLRDTDQYRGIRLELQSPVLLPSLSLLSSVSVSDQSYWSTVFRSTGQGWSGLTRILEQGGDIAVKRKSGAGVGQSLQWSMSSNQVNKLTSSSSAQVTTFLSSYLDQCPPHWVSMTQCLMSSSLATGAPAMVSVWSSLLSPLSSLNTNQSVQLATQVLLTNQKTVFVLINQSETSIIYSCFSDTDSDQVDKEVHQHQQFQHGAVHLIVPINQPCPGPAQHQTRDLPVSETISPVR